MSFPQPTKTNTEHDDDDHSGIEDEHQLVEADQDWDEGGPSQCGYTETVHETLMTVGESVHGVVGDPSETVEDSMKSLGNWFQEASYAVRDFVRGNKEVEGDAEETFNTMKADAYSAVSDMMGGSTSSTQGKIITSEGAQPASPSRQ